MKRLTTTANNHLGVINRFFKGQQLLLSFSKTNLIQFYKTILETSITMADKVIQEVGSSKCLGLTFDDCLSWDAHYVNNLSKELKSDVLPWVELPTYVT